MKTVLFFISIDRKSFVEQLEGIYRHFRDAGVHVQVVERGPHRPPVGKILEFWNPIGAFVEYGDESAVPDLSVFGSIPVVQFDIGRRLPQKGVSVGLDSEAVGRMGAEHLLALGLSHYAYAGFWKSVVWDAERERGFRESVRAAGCTVDSFASGAGRPSGRRSQRLLDWLRGLPKPCGILCANDRVGEEVLNSCLALSLDVPGDVAVLGVDNDRQLCENQMPALSSIDPGTWQGGRLAAEILDRLVARGGTGAGRREVCRFAPLRVVARASTRRLPCDRSKVTEALEAIRLHACGGMSVSDVVCVMGVSRRAAENHFRAATGRTIHEEIDAVRFARVEELLRNPRQSIGSICGLCGFSSEVALRKAFRLRTGQSMRSWRKMHGCA